MTSCGRGRSDLAGAARASLRARDRRRHARGGPGSVTGRTDYRFLIEYCRLFGLAAARAPDLTTLGRFADLLQATAHGEMELYRARARSGGSLRPRWRLPSPARPRAYTTFPCCGVPAMGDFAELVAALLPCMGLQRARQALAAHGAAEPRYAAGSPPTPTPSSPRSPPGAATCWTGLADGASLAQRQRMEEAFVTSSRYEYLFWEASWRLEI